MGRDGWFLATRAIVGLLGLAAVVWLVVRGPLVAPVSLFDGVGSLNAFYSTSHAVALGALAVAASLLGMAVCGKASIPASRFILGMALPLCAMGLATIMAVYPHDARIDLAVAATMCSLVGAFVFAIGPGDGEAIGPALAALGLVAVLGCGLAFDGLRQFASGVPTGTAWTGVFAQQIPIRVSATLHDPNALAALLLVGIAAACALAIAGRAVWVRLCGMALSVPMVTALLLTFSRAGWLGLAAMSLLAAVLLPRQARGWALVCFGVISSTVLVVGWNVPGVFFRAQTISVSGGGDVISRFFGWLTVLRVWRLHPLFGAGPGGLEALYAAHQRLGWHGTYVLIDIPGSADNDLLQWLSEEGLVGLLALGAGLSLACWAIVAALRGKRKRTVAGASVAAIVAALVLGLVVQGGLEVTAFLLPVEGVMAVVLAALTSASGACKAIRLEWRGRLAAAVLGCLALALAVGLHRTWLPERLFVQGWDMLARSPSRAGLALVERAAALDPSSERDLAAAGDGAVQIAYAVSPAARGPLEKTAVSYLGSALAVDPWDGNTWEAAAALFRLEGYTTVTACLQQAGIVTNPYDVWGVSALASDLRAIGQQGPGRTDAAYAAWLFPLELQVYAEHGAAVATVHQAQALEASDQIGWQGPLPRAPVFPLTLGDCEAPLVQAGFPAAAMVAVWPRA